MISVIMPIRNVQNIIGEVLDAIRWVPEVIVVDGYSTDKTLEIVKLYPNVKIMMHRSNDIRICTVDAEKCCSHDWIIWIQGDEVYTPELCQEIQNKLKSAPSEVHAYKVPQRFFKFGTDFGPGGTELRIWRKGLATFPFRTIHDMPEVHGKVEVMTNYYLHKNSPNLRQVIPKMLQYNGIDAEKASDSELERVNASFWWQLARLNYHAIRTWISLRKFGFGGTCEAFNAGMYQAMRHLMFYEETLIRQGKIKKPSDGW